MTSTVRGSIRGSSPGRGDWKETLGRVGLVGKGVLFAVVGLLAIQLATGGASEEASTSGAIEWIGSQPFGKFLLVALTLSLFAMAVWRALDAWLGDPVEGSEGKDRVKYAVEAVIYAALGVVALNDGPPFGVGHEQFVRLNFATSGPILERIVRSMGAAVRGR